VYGPPPVVETYLGMIRDAFLQVPGSQFSTHHDRDEATDRGAHVLHDRHRINNGIPSLDEMKLMEFVPNGGHIGFSPVSAPDGADALKQSLMVRRRADEYGKDYAAQFIVGLREMHHIGLFLFDTTDPAARQETLDLARLLIDEAAAEGYGEYRTHNALMDQVMGTYDWGDGALRRFHETVKDALDPNSIMAPGKSGIWGRRYRGQGH
jgi:4-cresol dehydrogenase (hydroxylating)